MSADQGFFESEPVMVPTWRAYLRHGALLLVTFCTATFAGVLFPFGKIDTLPESDPQSWAEVGDFIFAMPVKYSMMIGSTLERMFTEPGLLIHGLSFSLSLLFILMCHEMGHYVACRIYKVDATLPFFIPTPPLIGPAGTFGAFIKILSPMPSRRAVFDIGVAGPIAGFLALIPVALIGLATMKFFPREVVDSSSGGIVFADPLLFKLIAMVIDIDLNYGVGNAFYFAAWVGLLVTALNLIPSGQLDGGHAIYAVLGAAVHWWTGRIAFVVMAALSLLGWFVYSSPSGFLITILLGIMMRVKHPQPWDQTPLDGRRKVIAAVVLLIFGLSFVPFPIRIS